VIEEQAIDAVIRGIAQALRDTDTLTAFREGRFAFLLDCNGLTLVERGPELPPMPQMSMN
jgi:hypothetical protein